MRNPEEGVSLTAIVNELMKQGRTDIFGDFIHSTTGGTTRRARQIRVSESLHAKLSLVTTLLLVGIALLLFCYAATQVADEILPVVMPRSFPDLDSVKLDSIATQIYSVIQAALYVALFITVLGAANWFIFLSDPEYRDKIRRRVKIYRRLRYVEADHVVFDPATGIEAPATQEAISHLLNTLVDASKASAC